ncbi:MAG TPA: response regulator transcription factor, partial [Sulfuricurvum sp.]|nr:response regulator transcription factor [Sulfuricurvum sp.]
FTNAQDSLFENRFDIIILDVNLPDGNGFDLAKSVRSMGIGTPILFLTSDGSAESVTLGFESGGDDYLKKPFEPSELIARLKNLIRRSFFHTSSSLITLNNDYSFDPFKQQILDTSYQTIPLLSKELEAFKLLLTKRGHIVTYEDFFTELWGYGNDPGFDALRAHIKNLRKRLPSLTIETIRSIGYRFA